MRDVLQRQTVQMTRLVDDLLDVSRITRSTVALSKAPVDLRRAAREAADASMQWMQARQHQLHRAEQALEQPGLLEKQAHEHEERHRGERLLAHHLEELIHHQVEHGVAEARVAEQDPQDDQREGDRKADEDAGQQGDQHPDTDDFRAHASPEG